jgi:hypothetical protein
MVIEFFSDKTVAYREKDNIFLRLIISEEDFQKILSSSPKEVFEISIDKETYTIPTRKPVNKLPKSAHINIGEIHSVALTTKEGEPVTPSKLEDIFNMKI